MSIIQRRIVRGAPIRVGQREVVPEAQVTWWLRRRATVGMDGASGWGAGVISIRPQALVERAPAGELRIPVRDETLRMLIGVMVGALFVWFLTEIAVRLATGGGGES